MRNSLLHSPVELPAVNFNSHVLVAQHVETRSGAAEDFDFLVGLGSALPDLSSIARCRLVSEPRHPSIRRGVALHHATDRAFHDHQWFLDSQGELHDKLTASGLGRGAARACAHVGIELLLDGFLLRTRTDLSSQVESSFRQIPSMMETLTELAAVDKQDRWQSFLDRSVNWPIPTASDYKPDEVAGRLYRILESRRRLRFDESMIDSVADVLAGAIASLEAGAESLLSDVVDEVVSAGDRQNDASA